MPKQLDQKIDSLLTWFVSELSLVFSRAQARVLSDMLTRLSIKASTVLPGRENYRVFKQLPELFRKALKAEGYDRTVTQFLASFDDGVPYLEDILAKVTDHFDLKPVHFSADDLKFFQEVKTTTALTLEDAINQISQRARARVLFSYAGGTFQELAVTVAARLHVGQAEAGKIATTGLATFYRTMADTGYQKIEATLKPSGNQLHYFYYGPDDKLTRPFCERLLHDTRAGRVWTRPEIEAMDNGQLPNVFQTCGGYNCRHQWLVQGVGK